MPWHPSTRCVFLLGETGGGKTTFINAVLNFLFGVDFADSFRLQLKEETEDGRQETASQTDRITVYTIHYKEGMRHKYNFVLIDTPGLADTRGAQRQEHIKSHLENFLTSADIGVDEFHCVGLVAKGDLNRDFTYQKAMLDEIVSLLGDTVTEITCILATHAAYKPKVDAVVRNAGISFTCMFPFDNGILYTRQVMANLSESDQAAFGSMKWKSMINQYNDFFSHLVSAPSVSNRVRREKKLFDKCKENLKEGFKMLKPSIAKLEEEEKKYSEYDLQEAENKNWCETVMEEVTYTKDFTGLGNGYAHNCKICQVTCHLWRDSVGDVVDDATVSAVGTIAAAGTTAVVESTTLAGTIAAVEATAVGGTVAAAEATALAGTAAAAEATAMASVVSVAETAAIAGSAGAASVTSVPAVMMGVAAGGAVIALGALAVGTGYLISRMLHKTSVSHDLDNNGECPREGCHHLLSDHVREKTLIAKESVKREITNDNMKNRYSTAVLKKAETKTKINEAKKSVLSCISRISQNTVELMHHAMRIKEFTSQHSDYIESVTMEIAKTIRQATMAQALEHVSVLKKSMQQLELSYGAQEVRGQNGLLKKMLLSGYNKAAE